jgi:hypothetical protein
VLDLPLISIKKEQPSETSSSGDHPEPGTDPADAAAPHSVSGCDTEIKQMLQEQIQEME